MSRRVVLRPVRAEMPLEPTAEEVRIVSEHYASLRQLCSERVSVIVAEDPAVTSGVMTAGIRPYRIAVR